MIHSAKDSLKITCTQLPSAKFIEHTSLLTIHAHLVLVVTRTPLIYAHPRHSVYSIIPSEKYIRMSSTQMSMIYEVMLVLMHSFRNYAGS